MNVVELFLPICDRDGAPFEAEKFDRVRKELVRKFGGVTVYARTPVTGEWKPERSISESDDLIIFEVMADELDTAWWAAYRTGLQLAFRQESILCRASRVEIL